jgi:hypothetical protein
VLFRIAGGCSIRHNRVELAYHTFDKVRQVDQGAIAVLRKQRPQSIELINRPQTTEADPKYRSAFAGANMMRLPNSVMPWAFSPGLASESRRNPSRLRKKSRIGFLGTISMHM